jgi:hypothetical protein
MKDLNSENAFFENVSTDNLNFNSVNNDTPQSVNDVLAWNGSSWEVKAASDLGVGGGGGGGSTPSSFVSNIPAGVESHAITYGPFSSTPKIASSLEINGDGEIIPYTMSGVSATGYHAIFSDATPNANYNIHTVFGGESAGSSGGGLSYNEVVVTVSGAKFYIDGTQQLQLSLQRGLSYRFDQSDSTNSGHPIKFSTLSDGTHNTPAGSEYTAGIVYSGTPGSAGAYTEVTLSQSSPNLYYYCENHPQMGGSALGEIILKANGNVGIGTTNPAGTLELNSSSTDTNFYMGGTPSAGSREAWRFQAEGDILHIGQSKSSYAKYMTFFGSKVGIGATNPSHDLTLGSGTSAGTASTRLKIYRGADDPGQNLEMGYGHITVTRDANTLANPQSTFSIKQKGSDGERTAIHINTNGNVGIGTTNPGVALEVNGAWGSQFRISRDLSPSTQYSEISGGGSTMKFLSVSSNPASPGHSLFTFVSDDGTDELERMRIDSSGNVGIGTANPGNILNIYDSAAGSAGTSASPDWSDSLFLQRNIPSNYQGTRILFAHGKASIGGFREDNTEDGAHHLAFYTGGNISGINEAMRITNTGDVLVGATSINSGLGGVAQFEASNPTNGGIIINTQNSNLNNYCRLMFTVANTVGNEGLIRYNSNDYHMSFWTKAQERVRIKQDGNVGIGTTNPGVKLEVLGASAAIGTDSEIISVQTATANHRLSLGVNSDDEYAWIRSTKSGAELPLILQNQAGNVGVGTTSPNTSFHVSSQVGNGDGTVFVENTLATYGMGLKVKGGGNVDNERFALKVQNAAGDDILFAQSKTGNVGIGTTDPGSYKLYVNGSVFASSYYPTSDDRVKHNEQPIVGALETLSKITPKKYIKTTEMYDVDHDFKLDSDGNPIDENGESVEHRIEAGVIAQQVLTVDELAFAVTPEGVDEDENATRPHGLDYNSLFTYAIAAIQEQQKLIEDLRGEVEVLKKQIN